MFVQCHSWSPKQESRPRTVSRVMCLVQATDHCPQCPHSRFTVHTQPGVGHQTVACPRWRGGAQRHLSDMPSEYVLIPHETCLTTKPLEFCSSCPNNRRTHLPFTEPGWYEQRAGKKRGTNERTGRSLRDSERDGVASDTLQAEQRRSQTESDRAQGAPGPTHPHRAATDTRGGLPHSGDSTHIGVLDSQRSVGRDQLPATMRGREQRQVRYLPVLRG